MTVVSSNYLNFALRARHTEQPVTLPPEGPTARLNTHLAAVPEEARKEFASAEVLSKQRKDPNRCIDHLHRAIKASPQFSDAYVLLATLCMQQGKQAEAKTAVYRAIALDPRLPEAHFNAWRPGEFPEGLCQRGEELDGGIETGSAIAPGPL